MGGGTVMRSAVKVAGLGLIGSYRGVAPASFPLAERVVTARNSAIPLPSAIVFPSAANEIRNSTVSISSQDGMIQSSSVQRPSWEVNDWEFIGEEGEQQQNLTDLLDRTPRLVFGPVPSLEEAKEATSDLKDALDKLHFPPNSSTGGDTSHTESAVTLTSDSVHAFRAFSMLKNNPEVQNVVASLASDENVWEAVMKNGEVVEFYSNMNKNIVASTLGVQGDTSTENKSDTGEPFGNSITKLMQMIKLRVVAMVRNFLEFFHSTLVNPAERNDYGNDIWKNTTAGAALVVLTIATIMVVMVKRI